jgi:hypothetical protein
LETDNDIHLPGLYRLAVPIEGAMGSRQHPDRIDQNAATKLAFGSIGLAG